MAEWLVTCSCRLHPGVLLTVGRGVRGEASSGLSVPGTQHTLTIEEPPMTHRANSSRSLSAIHGAHGGNSLELDPRVGRPSLREQLPRRRYHRRLGWVEHQRAQRLRLRPR